MQGQVAIPVDPAPAGEVVQASAPSTKRSTTRLALNLFFGKQTKDVFSGLAQFIQDCTVELLCYHLAPVAQHRWSCVPLHAEARIWQKH